MTSDANLDIIFQSAKLRKEVNDQNLLIRRHGAVRAKKLRRRLDDMRAAPSLHDLRSLPQTRCHELKGDRAGQLSVDLDHPYRLIFKPAPPVPYKKDGGLKWTAVTAVIILGIEDTHD